MSVIEEEASSGNSQKYGGSEYTKLGLYNGLMLALDGKPDEFALQSLMAYCWDYPPLSQLVKFVAQAMRGDEEMRVNCVQQRFVDGFPIMKTDRREGRDQRVVVYVIDAQDAAARIEKAPQTARHFLREEVYREIFIQSGILEDMEYLSTRRDRLVKNNPKLLGAHAQVTKGSVDVRRAPRPLEDVILKAALIRTKNPLHVPEGSYPEAEEGVVEIDEALDEEDFEGELAGTEADAEEVLPEEEVLAQEVETGDLEEDAPVEGVEPEEIQEAESEIEGVEEAAASQSDEAAQESLQAEAPEEAQPKTSEEVFTPKKRIQPARLTHEEWLQRRGVVPVTPSAGAPERTRTKTEADSIQRLRDRGTLAATTEEFSLQDIWYPAARAVMQKEKTVSPSEGTALYMKFGEVYRELEKAVGRASEKNGGLEQYTKVVKDQSGKSNAGKALRLAFEAVAPHFKIQNRRIVAVAGMLQIKAAVEESLHQTVEAA